MKRHLQSFITRTFLIIAFLLTASSFGQTTLFQFNYETVATVTTNNTVGTPTFTYSGTDDEGIITSASCTGNKMFSASNWDQGDYYRYTVNTTGFGNLSFSFCGKVSSTAIGDFLIRVSTDGTNWTTVRAAATPTTNAATYTSNIAFPAAASNATQVFIDIYKSEAGGTNSRTMIIDNPTLTGYAIPFVTGFTPATACVGSTVAITGTNFTGATSVQVNNVNVASYTVNSNTSISAVIASGNTSGVIKVANVNGSGSSAGTLTINPSPTSTTAAASATPVCAGSAINLTSSTTSNSSTAATLINENFNAATNSWTKANTTSGGANNAAAAWTLRPEGYQYTTTNTVTFSSNDNSQFYLSNSDAPGDNSTTATTLQSPAFSTVGLSAASFSFYHYYRVYQAPESANVEISTNGTSWTSLAAYTTNQGASGTFAQVTFSLASYLNQPTVYVRFRYAATYDYYWAIDNVLITGTYSTPPVTYAWTSTPAGFTSSLQNPTNVVPTVNTTYTVTVTNSYGCTATASTALVTVTPASVGGTASANQTICSGTAPANLSLTGNTGSVTKWQKASDLAFTTPIDIAVANTTLPGATIGNLSATTYFRAVVQSGSCATANSSVVTITVNAVSVGGTAAANQTICSGTAPANLTLTGNTGSVTKWQKASDLAFTTPTDIAVANTTLPGATIGNLTATTYFRAVVQNSPCSTANSSVVTITVNGISVGGTASSSQTICSGTAPADLTLTGNTGSVTKWQKASDLAFTTPVDIAVANTTLTGAAIGNLTATTYFRAVVQNSPCSTVNSSVVTITVNGISVGGTASSNQTICSGTAPANLSLTGNTGSVTKWQKASDLAFTTPIDIAVANTTLTGAAIGNLSATTYFRAVVQNSPCSTANSSVVTITVDALSIGGTIAGSTAVCATSNGGTLTLSGYTGSVTKWQYSEVSDFSVGVLDIPNTTNTLGYSNLSTTTYYRAVVTSGSCGPVNSSVAAITVDPAAVGGAVSGSATVCAGSNSGTVTLNGYTGTIVKWQSSTTSDFTANVTDIAVLIPTLNYTNVTETTYYRAQVSSGSCTAGFSSAATITVSQNVWTGAVDSNWNEAGNWACGIVPTLLMDITIPTPAAVNQPVVSNDVFIHTLTMQSGTSLTVQTGYDLNITDVLTVASDATMTIENNANLIQVNDVNNSGNVIVKRNSSALMRQDYTLWSSPVVGQQLLAFSPMTVVTPTSRFYTYNTFTNLYNSVISPSATNFNESQGYLIRMPNNHPNTPTIWTGEFEGEPHNGAANFTMVNNGNGQRFNLVGNPYPSTIDADQFVSDNSAAITGTLYFWRKTNNQLSPSYCSWTSGGGFVDNGEAETNDPNGVIQTGQGFFVEASGFATSLNFNNGQRTGDNAGQFFRTNDLERNRIWLNVTNPAGAYSQMLVGYITGSTLGVDYSIDGRYINDGAVHLSSIINDVEYAIQGRPLPFEASDVVPLRFVTNAAGTYTIAIDHVDGLFTGDQDIFLRDNTAGVVHDLKASAYTFASDAGTFTGRFDVIYQNALNTGNPVWNADSVIVYNQNQQVVINSGNMIMASVKIFDIRGRLLAQQSKINASEVKLNAGQANQVLIVQITSDDNQIVTKKVMN